MSGSIFLRKNGYKAVRQWKKNKEREKKDVIEGKNGKTGHVYIFKLYEGYYKIGCAIDVLKRMKTLQASCPTIKCVFSAHVRDMLIAEKELHSAFKSQNIEREVFILTTEDIVKADRIIEKYR